MKPAVPTGTKSTEVTPETTAPSTPGEGTQKAEPGSTSGSSTEKSTSSKTKNPTQTPGKQPGTPQQTATSMVPGTYTPTGVPTEGIVGIPPAPLGRQAPDAQVELLKFEQIRIYAKDTGMFAGQANMINSGKAFLNALVIRWRIVDGSGNPLDQGQFTWPNLAPGETVTILFDGTQAYDDRWEKITFELQP